MKRHARPDRPLWDECYAMAFVGTFAFFVFQICILYTATTQDEGALSAVWSPVGKLLTPFRLFLTLSLLLATGCLVQCLRSVRLRRWLDLAYYVPAAGVFLFWSYTFVPFHKTMQPKPLCHLAERRAEAKHRAVSKEVEQGLLRAEEVLPVNSWGMNLYYPHWRMKTEAMGVRTRRILERSTEPRDEMRGSPGQGRN
jgi:hypothetical protein